MGSFREAVERLIGRRLGVSRPRRFGDSLDLGVLSGSRGLGDEIAEEGVLGEFFWGKGGGDIVKRVTALRNQFAEYGKVFAQHYDLLQKLIPYLEKLKEDEEVWKEAYGRDKDRMLYHLGEAMSCFGTFWRFYSELVSVLDFVLKGLGQAKEGLDSDRRVGRWRRGLREQAQGVDPEDPYGVNRVIKPAVKFFDELLAKWKGFSTEWWNIVKDLEKAGQKKLADVMKRADFLWMGDFLKTGRNYVDGAVL